MTNSKMPNKFSIIEIFLTYLTDTSKITLIFHFIWIMGICLVLSSTYIIAFHFTSLTKIYEEAHDIKNFDSNLKMSLETDNKLNSVLTAIMNDTSANRAYIFRFHNGLASVSGVPFFFQTNTHEVITPGTRRALPFSQRLPASINVSMNSLFLNNKCSVLNRIGLDPNSQYYYNFQSRGAQAMIRCPIFTSTGDLFGFVGLDYTEVMDDKFLNDTAPKLKVIAENLSKIYSESHR